MVVIYLKIIQLEFKKIIILTTDTLHHRFYINRIYEEGFIVDSVFFQKNLPKPNFKTGPLFESKEEKFEIENFFKTTSRDLNKKIKVYNVNNINDSIVYDKIKIIKPSLGLVFGTSLIKEKIYSLFLISIGEFLSFIEVLILICGQYTIMSMIN